VRLFASRHTKSSCERRRSVGRPSVFLEFQNGVKVRLQELDDGQRVEVLALSSEKVGIGKGRFIPADA
jgi:hypothetical protein